MPKFTAYHGDLKLSLRKTGISIPSIIVDTDEGDGIDFSFFHKEISKECYEEWINQLESVINKLKELKNENSND
jgi:hypothetical protein